MNKTNLTKSDIVEMLKTNDKAVARALVALTVASVVSILTLVYIV